LLLGAIETHQATLGCTAAVAADCRFYSPRTSAGESQGRQRVCIPPLPKSLSANASKEALVPQRQMADGAEGRISVVKRRNGLVAP